MLPEDAPSADRRTGLPMPVTLNLPGGAASPVLQQSTAFWSQVEVPLTAEQKAAISHIEGPLLVVAGPGSGKTTVITYRVAYLTQVAGVDPASLLVVTFTKAAADEMKRRAARAAGAAAARVTFGTFHALAYRILRHAGGGQPLRVLNDDDQLGLLRRLVRHLGLNSDDETVMQAQAEISRMRAFSQEPAEFRPKNMAPADFRRLWAAYCRAKEEQGMQDFDDLLHGALGVLQQRSDLLAAYRKRYHFVMVDEFQDTNPVQWELVRLLAAPRNNLCVVGDDDQSIYGWRGASPQFLLQFPQVYPGAARVTLDLNHRCPLPVVEAANRLAAHNKQRFAKRIRAVRERGISVQLMAPADSLQEAEEIAALIKRGGVPLSHWAVIYRTNQQAHVIAQVLSREQIPFRALGGLPNLYRRWPVQDVLCYLRAALGDSAAVEPVINRPSRYISRAVLEEAKRIAARRGCRLLDAIGETELLRSWQLRPVEELRDHLQRLALMNAPQAIGYVRRVVGYDDYIQEYCAREGGSAEEMLGLLAEVERTVPDVPLMAFLAHVDAYSSRSDWAAGAGEEAVTLLTCHKAKGLEFPRVVVAGVTDKMLPHRGSENPEEERRLLYVAMTRASERLWLSAPCSYEGREVQPSPFIAEALGPAALAYLAGEQKAAAGRAPAAAKQAMLTGPAASPRATAAPVLAPEGFRPNAASGKVPAAPAVPAQGSRPGAAPAPAAQVVHSNGVPLASTRPTPAPTGIRPGMAVRHVRHGEGRIESVDPERQRVTIDFGGKRLSLDLSWCLGSPEFFEILAGD